MATKDKTENKKYSKKRSIAGKVLNAGMMAIIGAILIPETLSATKMRNYKTNQQITFDAQYFDANMDIANIMGQNGNFKTTYKRLRHNGEKPIFVTISEKFSPDEVEAIKDVLNYYQQLFSKINSNYRFKVVNGEKAIFEKMLGNTVINFDENTSLTQGYAGLNLLRANFLNPNFLKTSRIYIDPSLTEAYDKYYVYMHELAHAFGLGDVYETLTPNHYGNTFLSGSAFAYEVNMLYPNDVAMLFAMYGESYRNGKKILPQELEKSQKAFEEYKQAFYQKAKQVICEQYSLDASKIDKIDVDTIQNKSLFHSRTYFNQLDGSFVVMDYQIDFLDNKKALFKILDNKEVITQVETPYEIYDGMVFLPALHLPQGLAPNFGSFGKETFMLMSIYQNKGQLYSIDMDAFLRMALSSSVITPTKSNTIGGKILHALFEEMQKPDEIELDLTIELPKTNKSHEIEF